MGNKHKLGSSPGPNPWTVRFTPGTPRTKGMLKKRTSRGELIEENEVLLDLLEELRDQIDELREQIDDVLGEYEAEDYGDQPIG